MATDNGPEKWAAVMQTLTVLGVGGILLKGGPAQASSASFPPEAMALLQALSDGMGITIEQLSDILTAIGNIQLGGGVFQGWPPNADYVIAAAQDLLIINTPFQLPSILIPDGFELIVKAHPLNPPLSLVRVAKSAGESIDPYSSYPLLPNEWKGYKIKNASALFVSASVAPGCTVVWTVEQRK